MAESYIKNQRRVLPCAAYVNGAYGLSGIYVGVPTLIGTKGVEKIIEIELGTQEAIDFKKSVDSVRGLIQACKNIDDTLIR